MDIVSLNQQMYSDYEINYKNYCRRVSKYDVDRAAVDFKKLRREKETDRTQNVKIKREEVDTTV